MLILCIRYDWLVEKYLTRYRQVPYQMSLNQSHDLSNSKKSLKSPMKELVPKDLPATIQAVIMRTRSILMIYLISLGRLNT